LILAAGALASTAIPLFVLPAAAGETGWLSGVPVSKVVEIVLVSLTGLNWRFGVRGITRVWSWKTALFAMLSAPVALIAFMAVRIALTGEALPQILSLLTGYVAIPIGREALLRGVGYRTINVYAERRRRLKEAVATEPGSV
jgi:hypothetical protein